MNAGPKLAFFFLIHSVTTAHRMALPTSKTVFSPHLNLSGNAHPITDTPIGAFL